MRVHKDIIRHASVSLEKAFSLRKLLKGVFQQNELVAQKEGSRESGMHGCNDSNGDAAKGRAAGVPAPRALSADWTEVSGQISRREQSGIDRFI